MNKVLTTLFLGASMLMTVPSAFAERGDRGWIKSDRHQGTSRNTNRSKTWKVDKHSRSAHNNTRNNTRNNATRHNNTRSNGTRHNNTRHGTRPHNNTRHNNTRHGIRDGIRNGTIRHGGIKQHVKPHRPTRHIKPDRHIRHTKPHRPIKHIKPHRPIRHNNHNTRRHLRHNNHRNYYPSSSFFLSFDNDIPLYVSDNKLNIWDRLKNQKRRVRAGVDNGQLVHSEAKFLRQELRRIKDRIAHYKADGHFTRYERSEIQRLLDRSNDYIYEHKHNGVNRNNHHQDSGYNYYH